MYSDNAFSEYIVFVDESGDHDLTSIDSGYPIFVLAFCVFKKEDYIKIVCPKVQEFKLRWFGHDTIILHEREIRKDLHPFQFLKSPSIKNKFMDELTDIIKTVPVTIIPFVIRKEDLKEKYQNPHNPYHLALLFGIERLNLFLKNRQQTAVTHIIFEQRGGKQGGGEEDKLLELEFLRITSGQNRLNRNKINNLEIKIVSKASNSVGLQLADLVARPIGIHYLRPDQPNRAFEIIRSKFLNGDDMIDISGIKIFP